MAATALIGAPFTMKAMAGPEPIPMSMLSEAIPCCMRASPAKAVYSTATPCWPKKPLRIPISTGTNENASATALPTRRSSAAFAEGAKPKMHATMRTSAVEQ
jgi:hypothetical protein